MNITLTDSEITPELVERVKIANDARNQALLNKSDTDPASGRNCIGPRVMSPLTSPYSSNQLIPREMAADPEIRRVSSSDEWVRLRCRYDFEFWAFTCVTIRDKTTGNDIPFRLNAPQRRVLDELEKMRRSHQPIRMILLKARQWGGSTLVQLYMAWIQTCLRRNWNSIICAHVKDAAANIRGMYTKLLDNYPQNYWDGDEPPSFRPFERSSNIRTITGRGSRVTLASAENQDSIRGMDVSMAHLSEVAFWRDTPKQNPDGFIRAVCGAVNSSELTLIVLESTANGVGNYFHSEWVRAQRGESDKTPVFVPWYEIGIYSCPVSDVATLLRDMDNYERMLWNDYNLTLQQIAWYHCKRREYRHHHLMMAEYPTTPDEAFRQLGNSVFDAEEIERLRQNCRPGTIGDFASASGAMAGEGAIVNPRFVATGRGKACMWSDCEPGANYIVTVDIGGRSQSADWSVILAMKTGNGVRPPEVVAQWRGHIDHDFLAWLAARIATYYNHALLVFESNTLESETIEGDPAEYILNQVASHYHNLYRREGGRPGFHTNRSTKTLAINALYAAVRDNTYIERDDTAINELLTYQSTHAGGFAASPGNHDDCVMTRAIALHILATQSVYSVLIDEAARFIRTA